MAGIEFGSGVPLVFVPGVQGRWEFHRRTLVALARHFRVITFSLSDAVDARTARDAPNGVDRYAAQLRDELDVRQIDRAVVIGMSFGGRVALRFAASDPARVSALVLASTPGPDWQLKPRHEMYLRAPWIFAPFFMIEGSSRAAPELVTAIPSRRERLAFMWSMARTMLKTHVAVGKMAARARLISSHDARADCASVTVPTLLVTGEPSLDYVVPVQGTSQYAQLIAGATGVVQHRTGHQGSLTRPEEFAAIVRDFVSRSHHAAA